MRAETPRSGEWPSERTRNCENLKKRASIQKGIDAQVRRLGEIEADVELTEEAMREQLERTREAIDRFRAMWPDQ